MTVVNRIELHICYQRTPDKVADWTKFTITL